ECAGIGVKEHVRIAVDQESKSFGASLKIMWSCKPFRRLIISGILRSPIALFNNLIITLATYYYCDGNLMNILKGGKILVVVLLFAVGYAVGAFGSTLIVPVLMKKWDVKTLYNATAFSAIPMVLIFVAYLAVPDGAFKEIGWGIVVAFLILLGGSGQGVINVCQSVMITDCIDYEEYHTNYRPDGVFFSGQSFITKLSAGVASLISAYVFAYVGYTDINIAAMNDALNKGASFALDYSQYSWAMWFLVTVPAGIGLAIAVIPTLKYEITPEHREEIHAALKIKHDQAEEAILAAEAAEKAAAEESAK
ncbi:MAG TPA: MFS transporter, partial [Clostridiales bacterium]|nr:MFS transporter [Clostridiales bacterium]